MKNFKLKMSLFRIWFVKNIVLFLEILAIVLFILVFTGVLPESTPIFGPLIMEIRAAEGDSSGWIKALSISTTCLTSVGLFLTRVKSIALSDIKSDKLKLSLVHANMYFNEKGKLVKKVEKATGTDIDDDGKIDDKETKEPKDEGISNVKVATNLFTGIRDAVSDFFAIATLKLDDDEDKAKKQAQDVIKDHDMKNAAEAINEITDIKNEAFNNKVNRIVDETVDEAVGDTQRDDTISDAEKKDRIHIIKRLGEWFKMMFHKARKTPEEKAAIKAEKLKEREAKKAARENAKQVKAAEKQFKAEQKAKKANEAKKQEQPKKEEKKNIAVAQSKPVEQKIEQKSTAKDSTVNSFLTSLRSR